MFNGTIIMKITIIGSGIYWPFYMCSRCFISNSHNHVRYRDIITLV
jgi:hypothetical protein